MGNDVLWYAARVTGLMTQVLACGALISGLLLRSQADRQPSPARLWATDANRFLGLASAAFLVVHGSTVLADSRFDLAILSTLVGRGLGGWLMGGLLAGLIAGWLLLLVEGLRLLEARLPRMVKGLATGLALIVVLLGGYHGWTEGSDVRNPFSLVVLAGLALAVLVSASLAYGAEDDLRLAPRPRDRTHRPRDREDPGQTMLLTDRGRVTAPGPQAARPEIVLPQLRRSRLIDGPERPPTDAGSGPDGSQTPESG